MTIRQDHLIQHPKGLPAPALRRICNPLDLGFDTTEKTPLFEGLVGQERALEALDMGARMDKPGFNLFILGERGTARHGIVRSLVEKLAASMSPPLFEVLG